MQGPQEAPTFWEQKSEKHGGVASLWPGGVQGKAMPLAGCTAWHEFIKHGLDQEALVS